MKKIMCLLLVLPILLVGCGKKEDEKPKEYVLPVLKREHLAEGFYIMKPDGTFRQFFALELEQKDPAFTWMPKEWEPLIPDLEKGDKIVFLSLTQRPNVFTFKKMKDQGYTLGTNFGYGEYQDGPISKEYFVFGPHQYEYSSVYQNGKPVPDLAYAAVKEINGQEFQSIMLDELGFLKGLTPHALYRINYYVGTIYKSVDFRSDTRVFIEDGEVYTTHFEEDKNTMFLIEMPEEAVSGYYYLNGAGGGLFRYTGNDVNKIKEKEIVSIDEEEKPENQNNSENQE